MTIKLIGLKQFRDNIATYTVEARKKNTRLIILKKNVPMFEVVPIDEKTFALEKLKSEIKEARDQIKKGKVYTQEQIMKEFGLL
ncbi:MAG: hypothetical protein A2V81_02900 [Candidatus Abawacabacteria bacterium RBG_16_42_10]|uniref:Antitoxin n=1 Tax=Candidatus Abawacabacteria bacterium RBG_16_42_10 TaxID=1817814 RepID=A0A1F4XK42_9BACT|nr:MAG: hypothetical protein A2V81_02900 [Candidatus Abawacabacteria bacterium RBG_16_42_10]